MTATRVIQGFHNAQNQNKYAKLKNSISEIHSKILIWQLQQYRNGLRIRPVPSEQGRRKLQYLHEDGTYQAPVELHKLSAFKIWHFKVY